MILGIVSYEQFLMKHIEKEKFKQSVSDFQWDYLEIFIHCYNLKSHKINLSSLKQKIKNILALNEQ